MSGKFGCINGIGGTQHFLLTNEILNFYST